MKDGSTKLPSLIVDQVYLGLTLMRRVWVQS